MFAWSTIARAFNLNCHMLYNIGYPITIYIMYKREP